MDGQEHLTTASAAAVEPFTAAEEAWPFELRGRSGQLRRIPSLDVASNQQFLTEFRTWIQADPEGLWRTARQRCLQILNEHGFEPSAELPMQHVIEMMEADPTMMMAARSWLAVQQLTWDGVKQLFHAHEDAYLEELRAAEKKGPGSLELNPTMDIPDYVKHEIHIMPGGYVGDPLGGYIYHYGTNAFHMGHNDQDEKKVAIADAVPTPSDGKVRRVLEIGCSVGQTAVALKRRFPDAEVWALDIGGPMVHYGHMRAAGLGVDVNFRQALAEDSGFPDDYFDVVLSYIILHEVPNVKNTEIMKEVSRILRSGGTYYPVDFFTSGQPRHDAFSLFFAWWDHRWNNEVWALEHREYDLVGDLERFGMDVTPDGPPASMMGPEFARPNMFATKLA